MKRTAAGISLGAVLGATVVTLALGAAQKAPCAAGDWGDGRQYRLLCYTDIVPLYGAEHLDGDRLPYLDPCPPAASGQCDEYPVLTMYFMRAAAWLSRAISNQVGGAAPYAAFFWVNAALLALCAVAAAGWAFRVAGGRALSFAVAPTLLVYAFVNWDLLAVALATAATAAYVRGRDRWSGALLGLGAAAKLYPALLVVPFAAGRLRTDRRAAGAIVGFAALAYVAVNLPFALLARPEWATFFRFNAHRAADWDSLWFVACERLHDGATCPWSASTVNRLSVVAFAVLAVGIYVIRRRRDPGFARWTFGFPLLVAFLLTNKVYSPQYGLWLLPWFAFSLPNPWWFAAFEAADVAVFVTRFSWFGRLSADLGDASFAGYAGTPLGGFEIAVVIRAVVLAACLVAWVRRTDPPPARELETAGVPSTVGLAA